MTSMTKRLDSAILWATEVHAGEARDGDAPLPYIVHPIEVLALVRYVGLVVDEDVLCAAVLHDVVESGKVSASDVEERFGPKTRALVAELTRTEPEPEKTNGLDEEAVWRLRADLLVDDVGRMSPEAQTIKLADRISNLAGALATKRGGNLKRHLRQAKRILKAVSKKSNPPLRTMLKERLAAAPKRRDTAPEPKALPPQPEVRTGAATRKTRPAAKVSADTTPKSVTTKPSRRRTAVDHSAQNGKSKGT